MVSLVHLCDCLSLHVVFCLNGFISFWKLHFSPSLNVSATVAIFAGQFNKSIYLCNCPHEEVVGFVHVKSKKVQFLHELCVYVCVLECVLCA